MAINDSIKDALKQTERKEAKDKPKLKSRFTVQYLSGEPEYGNLPYVCDYECFRITMMALREGLILVDIKNHYDEEVQRITLMFDEDCFILQKSILHRGTTYLIDFKNKESITKWAQFLKKEDLAHPTTTINFVDFEAFKKALEELSANKAVSEVVTKKVITLTETILKKIQVLIDNPVFIEDDQLSKGSINKLR